MSACCACSGEHHSTISAALRRRASLPILRMKGTTHMTMDWEESPTPAPSRGPESDTGDSPALLLSHDELRHIFQFVPELDRCADTVQLLCEPYSVQATELCGMHSPCHAFALCLPEPVHLCRAATDCPDLMQRHGPDKLARQPDDALR